VAAAVVFTSPRHLPDPQSLVGRVVVLDIAFAADGSGGVSFASVTAPFIAALGDRLALWVDHHDHPEFTRFAGDDRFVLRTKQQAGACPELVTVELVDRTGPVDTIVTHLDLDGIYAAAKWLLGGREPYPGADADARAVDTRIGEPSPTGKAVDQALRASFRDESVRFRVLRFLTEGARLQSAAGQDILELSQSFERIAEETRAYASRYRVEGKVAHVTVAPGARNLDKTYLLLLGQEKAPVAVVSQSGMMTVAAAFDSGYDFTRILGMGGGMPTRVSLPVDRLGDLLAAINGPGTAPRARPRRTGKIKKIE
jgi:hypothetical protein